MARLRAARVILAALSAVYLVAAVGEAVAQPAPRASSGKPAEPAAKPTTGGKVEVTTFDSWILTCQTPAAGGARACSGQARIIQTNPANQQSRVVFRWTVGMDGGKPVGLFDVPTGVKIAPGVEVQIGKDFKRKLPFEQCGAAGCQAVIQLDDSALKSAQGAAALDATIVAIDQRQIKFSLDLKGFDKVMAELRK